MFMLFFRFFSGDNSPKLCKKISHIQSCQQTKKVVGKKLKTLAPSFGQPFQFWIKKWIKKNVVFLFTCLKTVRAKSRISFITTGLPSQILFCSSFCWRRSCSCNISLRRLEITSLNCTQILLWDNTVSLLRVRIIYILIRTHYFASTVPKPAFSLTLKIKNPKFFFKI